MTLTLGFHGLCRPGKLTFLPHVITIHNIHIGLHSATITLPTSKSNCSSMPQQIVVHASNTACPVAALTAYFRLRPHKLGQLFIKLNGTLVFPQDLAAILAKLAQFLNLPAQLIKPHSLRIGGSTHLYLSGFDLQYIQNKGRWASQAFRRYIHC